MVKIEDKGPVADDVDEVPATASQAWRDKDGRPHLVPAQEEAARDAQRSENRDSELPASVFRMPPD